MKFTVLQENLAKSLSAVSRIVSSKPTLPILSNVLIEADSNKVTLSATDLDLGLTTWVGTDVEAAGKITVSARTFSEFINSLPKGKIEIELVGNQLNVKANGNAASFNVIPADDFPALAEAKGKPITTINANELKEALDQVVFAAAIDDARPAWTGIQFEAAGKNLLMVAVDGFRLSKKTLKLESALSEFSPLVPGRSLLELSRILSDVENEDDAVEIYEIKDKNQLVFRFGEYDLITRLIDAKFPDYKAIIPGEYTTRVILETAELQNTVKIINIFARNVVGNKSILNIMPEDGKLSLQAAMAEVGENQSEMQVAAEGDSLVVAFSAKYMNDMLNNINSEYLVFESQGADKPGIFRPADVKGEADENYMHIIMPMRLE